MKQPPSNAAVNCTRQNHRGLSLEISSSMLSYAMVQFSAADEHRSTVGAGDTFVAAVLFMLLLQPGKYSMEQMLRFANKLASDKIQREGFADLDRRVGESTSSRDA